MTHLITFNPAAILYANIYKPCENFGNAHYQLVLDADRIILPEELVPYVTHSRRPPESRLRLRTAYKRPPVSLGPGQSYDILARALAILDAQNKPRDDIFKWCALVTVFAEEWRMVASWGVMRGHEIQGLSPVSLTITLDEERIPA